MKSLTWSCLALKVAFGQWYNRLEDASLLVEIWTDHMNLEMLQTLNLCSLGFLRWSQFFSHFDLYIAMFQDIIICCHKLCLTSLSIYRCSTNPHKVFTTL